MALRQGLVLAALLLAPCALADMYGVIPTVCVGGACDPSNHIENVTIHWTTDVEVQNCVDLFTFLDTRPDLSLWRDLMLRYKATLSLDKRPGTYFIPSNKAIQKNLAEINYDWPAFLALGDTILIAILQYNFIPVEKITSGGVTWSLPPKQTGMPLTFLTLRPNKWRTFSINGTFTGADVMPDCADKMTCNAVVHITTGLLVPFKLPDRAKPWSGCYTLYNYIGSRGDMQHLKAAIDKVTNVGDGTNRTMKQVLDNPRLIATVFLPTDPVWDAWIKVSQITWAGRNVSVPVVHLDDLPANVITAILFNHIVAGYQYEVCDFISGYMLDPLSPRYLLIDREDGRVKLWADLSKATIVYPDIETCSVVLHLLNWPLLPSGFDVTQYSYLGHSADDDSYKVLQRSGSWERFGDLVCETPVLSGLRDLIKGTQLEGMANDKDVLLTWFAPTNIALLNMAARTGWMTNDFFANSRYRLNFLNYHAIPYSALPTKNWADKQQIATAYKPNSVTLFTQQAWASKLGVQGALNPAVQPLTSPYYDLVCGKALANLLYTGCEALLTDFRGIQ